MTALEVMAGDFTAATLPRKTYQLMMDMLAPLECLVRRLLVLMLCGLPVLAAPKPRKAGVAHATPAEAAPRIPLFRVSDPAGGMFANKSEKATALRHPRRATNPYGFPAEHAIAPTHGLFRRIRAVIAVFDDPLAHASRLAKWQARQDRAGTGKTLLRSDPPGITSPVLSPRSVAEMADLHHAAHDHMRGPLGIDSG